MHKVVENGLENYLARSPFAAQREIDAHLKSCEECRREVQVMQEMSGLFESLKAPEPVLPSAGFYARLSGQLGDRRRISFWNLFSLDPAFGRRVVFTSLLTLAVLGSYLVARETEYSVGPTNPEAIMAQTPAIPDSGDRDRMLITLATYEP